MSLLDVADAGEAIGKLVSFWTFVLSRDYRSEVTSRWRRATIARRVGMGLKALVATMVGLGVPGLIVWLVSRFMWAQA